MTRLIKVPSGKYTYKTNEEFCIGKEIDVLVGTKVTLCGLLQRDVCRTGVTAHVLLHLPNGIREEHIDVGFLTEGSKND